MKTFILHIRFVIALCSLLLSYNGYGQLPKITFSEINYHSDSTRDAGDWVELHNYGTSPADISRWIFTDSRLSHFFYIPSGTVLQPGGYWILSQDTDKFIRQYPSVKNYCGSFAFGLSGGGELIQLFDAQTNLYLSMEYQDTLDWPKGADGYGKTLELVDPNADLNDPANWFSGCMGGSPGRAYSSCNEKIVFSEINYNSSSKYEDAGDWVEIRNVSNQPVDVSGWIFRDKNDSDTFIIPVNTILNAGNNLVLSGSLKKFNSVYPSVTNVVGSFFFGFKSSGDILRLFDAEGTLYESVTYKNSSPWPAGADGNGYTLELADSSASLDDGKNWFTGCIGGSPGEYYYSYTCSAIAVHEMSEKIHFSIHPNPVTTNVELEINSENEFFKGGVSLSIYDAVGKEVLPAYMFLLDKTQNRQSISVKLPVGLSPGIYFYQLNYNDEAISIGKLMIAN